MANDISSESLDAYIECLCGLKRSPATIRLRRSCINRFLKAHPDARLQDITTEHIGRYRKSMIDANLTQWTINTNLCSLQSFFQYLTDQGVIFLDPTAEVKVKTKGIPMAPVLTEDEVNKLLSAPDASRPIGIRDRAILEVLYSSAMRRNELLGLKVDDIDLNNAAALVMGKGQKERVVPLGKHAVKWTHLYLTEVRPGLLKDDAEPALWINRFGGVLDGHSLEQFIRRHCITAGIRRIGPHTLRRSCATHMLAHGAHPMALCELLGHSTAETIKRYLKADIEDIRRTHSATNPGR